VRHLGRVFRLTNQSAMPDSSEEAKIIAADIETLHRMGYRQELVRRMSGFSNYAISLSIICILSGGVTSFHQGLCSVGGAAIGVGWPAASLLALAFAATMGQVASAFPTAGGLYHWASILGDRGWGWATAWFNLAGLVTALAAVNVGAFQFAFLAFGPWLGYSPQDISEPARITLQLAFMLAVTGSQAMFNHLGIRVTTRLTDFSGYLILVVATVLTAAMLWYASSHDFSRLITWTNYSGLPKEAPVWPFTENVPWLFALGFMLPMYTITGFDASAHTAEETVGAAEHVPRAIIRSVLVSGIFGWAMLAAVVLAIPNMNEAAAQGENVFYWIMGRVLPGWLQLVLCVGIAIAQYLCGLATLTSTSRMTYAFARDGGMPGSRWLRQVSTRYRSPAIAIWAMAALAIGFTIYTPVYTTIATVCVIFLYLSYGLPTLLGLIAYGRTWTAMGPWSLGGWYRLLAVICILGCAFLLVIGVQPPNDKALWIVLGSWGLTAAVWFGYMRYRFEGPPHSVLLLQRQADEPAEQFLTPDAARRTHDAPGELPP
jgi:amino acid transporter